MQSIKRTYQKRKSAPEAGTRQHARKKAFSLQKKHKTTVFIYENSETGTFDYGFVIPLEVKAANVYRLKDDKFFDGELVSTERVKPSDVKDANYTYRKKAEACIRNLQANMLDRCKIHRIDWETPFEGRVLVTNPSGISNVHEFTVNNHNGSVKYRTKTGNWLTTKPLKD